MGEHRSYLRPTFSTEGIITKSGRKLGWFCPRNHTVPTDAIGAAQTVVRNRGFFTFPICLNCPNTQ